MPIKGISEQKRLPRLGKIHLGVKVQKKNDKGEVVSEYPKATDYFVCPPEVQAVYGEKPQRLDVIIPLEDEELWASQYYRQYSRTRGLVCRGDGVGCRRMIDKATGDTAGRDTKTVTWKEGMPCAGRECPDYQGKKCREVMNLQFLLPEVPGLGIWQIDTGSINSIRNINSCAAMVRAVCGKINWIPLVLTLEPVEVGNPDDGKKKVVRCLNLRHEKGLRELLLASGKGKAELLITAPAEDEAPLDAPNGKAVQALEPGEFPDVDFTKLKSASVPTKGATADPGSKAQPVVDMAKLKADVKALGWTGVVIWLKAKFDVPGETVTGIVAMLTPEQQREFEAEVKSRLEMKEPK